MEQDPKKTAFLKEFLAIREDLFAFVYSMIPSYAQAEDVFQDASIVLWDKFETFTPGTNFKAWSRAVMYNQIRNEWQRSKREELWDPQVFASLDRAFEQESYTHNEWAEALSHCLKKLSDTAKKIIHYKYFESKSYKEIGELLERSEKGTRVVLHRVRVSLAECIRRTIKGISE